jgi:hypothetical protein
VIIGLAGDYEGDRCTEKERKIDRVNERSE